MINKLRFHCFQQVAYETPGYLTGWIEWNGFSLTTTHFFEEFQFPAHDTYDVLLIMGGFMSVNDEEHFPWLKQEKNFIAEAIQLNKKVIGICLGSQLIASALGARVYPNYEKEIGFFPIAFNTNYQLLKDVPQLAYAFHWHGETFDLPEGAELIACSKGCLNQAFVVKNALALQFHLEVNEPLIKDFLSHGRDELISGTYIQLENEIVQNFQYIPECNMILEKMISNFVHQ
jgi:GMP synthase-like glutamine amidotransferase